MLKSPVLCTASIYKLSITNPSFIFPPEEKQYKDLTNTMLENEAYLSKTTHLPRKRFFRARAHSNPLSDSHFPVPVSPSQVDYSVHYPQLHLSSDSISSKKVEFADIGCGFGGLLISLATLFPETLMIGMELRDKVTEYVKERIVALRKANPEKNHRRRVISPRLLDEYAYALRVGGIIYTITDVEELGEWMNSCLKGHPLFEALTQEELDADPVVNLLSSATEEGQKVSRNGGQTFQAIYRRIIPFN
ncbi:tRNA (guanine-N(7)-)-methyltransferase [Heracleum sosnowskyi]|uniref:tRNA (guanine-N(7)-)-methyltransferase n=1 Tax=Heracleum sosnowskyi TaxID=360622 RepID=A0AAD8MSF2_9APIA|nr:tRNA (guanine-N(7)-)-methyltransferase [Heracleum sosnowskyi]